MIGNIRKNGRFYFHQQYQVTKKQQKLDFDDRIIFWFSLSTSYTHTEESKLQCIKHLSIFFLDKRRETECIIYEIFAVLK